MFWTLGYKSYKNEEEYEDVKEEHMFFSCKRHILTKGRTEFITIRNIVLATKGKNKIEILS